MLRTRLLTASAAVALFAAGSSFAQTTPADTAAPAQQPAQTQSAPIAGSDATPASTNTVVDVLRADGQFTTLLSALDAAQLTETLTTQPAISIFAPTDAAFAALPEAERTRLLDPANVNELRQVLLYHVVVADVNSSQIKGALGGVETAASTQVQLDGTGDAIKVDAATVTTADIDASNGAIFIIDRVLNPAESLVATGDADEATAPAEDTTSAPAPAEATPPANDDMTGTDDMDDGALDEGAVTAPPVASSTTTAPDGRTTTDVTTTASPPVANPTDGAVDGQDDADDVTPEPQP